MYSIFFPVSLLLIFISGALIIFVLFRKPTDVSSENEIEISFLTDQLNQIEKDIKMDLISKSDADITKTILSRKILKLIDINQKQYSFKSAPIKSTIGLTTIFALLISLGTITTYIFLGNTHYLNKNNSPTSNFLSQDVAETALKGTPLSKPSGLHNARLYELVSELKQVLDKRPNDLEGHMLLVKNSTKLEDYPTARKAQAKVLEILGNNAISSDFSKYAELCVRAAAGYVSTDVIAAIQTALEMNPENSQAQYFLSRKFIQENKFSDAYKIWINLLEKEDETSPWIGLLTEEIFYIAKKKANPTSKTKKIRTLSANALKNILPVLNAWEYRLEASGGSFLDWGKLIATYSSLGLSKEEKMSISKASKLLALDTNQIKELKQIKVPSDF